VVLAHDEGNIEAGREVNAIPFKGLI